MKKLAVLAAAAAVATGAFAEAKIGRVDMMVLVRNHSSYETNKKLVTDTESDSQKRLADQKKRLDAIEEEGRKLAEEYRNPMLAASKKAKIEEQIADVQKRYLALQNKVRNDMLNDQRSLADLESSLLKSQAEEIKETVAKFAEENGYDMILEASAFVYSAKSVDVTDMVLERMGVDPAKAIRSREDATNEGK
ncbi:MAG: OmpH family outer membrane protein [Kiritimatiellae bacterium]|nr:OmpH family outer membrane protein [Kiritimatiellia bacterium]